jgi:hypothetical protein
MDIGSIIVEIDFHLFFPGNQLISLPFIPQFLNNRVVFLYDQILEFFLEVGPPVIIGKIIWQRILNWLRICIS